VKKYVNLHKAFDPEEGEVTRTRKLRRDFLEERYNGLIHAIYNNKTQVQIEVEEKHQNRLSVKTTISIKRVEGAD
jgi:long-chain acyl-CoA synthetase